MTVEILTLLIRLGIVIITGLIIPALRAWLKAKTDNEKLNQLKTAAETAVYAAEQMHRKLEDSDDYQEARRKCAKGAISRAAHKLGLVLTDTEIDELMEAAVQELNLMKYGSVREEIG